MKSTKLFFIAIILSFPAYKVFSAPQAVYDPECDFDSNGWVDSADQGIFNKIFSGEWQETQCREANACACSCDLNKDGKCDEGDEDEFEKHLNSSQKNGYWARIDFDKDYEIGYEDLEAFSRDWGRRNCRIGNACDCACDLNFDGICDDSDYEIFGNYYQPPKEGYSPKCDFDSDGKISSDDFASFEKIASGAYGPEGCAGQGIYSCSCDFNSDSKCDILDKVDIESRIGATAKENYDPRLDYNKDYLINYDDLVLFNEDWDRNDCRPGDLSDCGCDLDSNGRCDDADYVIFEKFYDPAENAGYDPVFDLNSNGLINIVDFDIFKNIYTGAYSLQSCRSFNACVCSCDFNNDLECDLLDIVEFKRHMDTVAKAGYLARCDFNDDYLINYSDVVIFDKDWRRTDCDPGNFCDCECDVNSDGICDIADIEIFTQYYKIEEDLDAVDPIEPSFADEYAEKAYYFKKGEMETVFAQIGGQIQEAREREMREKHLPGLLKNSPSLSAEIEAALARFLAYGADLNTKSLGEGERAAVLFSYKAAFGKMPEDEAGLADIFRIANGRWPNLRSKEAEFRAKAHFKKIYKRIADPEDPKDDAAITVMSYGLRQKAENRNLASEKAGIMAFKSIYGHVPESTEDWNIMQAITYSGAARQPDRDRDYLPDRREMEWGMDPDDPDTDNDGYLDGIEIEEGY